MFEVGNYSTNLKNYDRSNKLVIRKMKNETGGIAIKEFVGLRAKNIFILNEYENQKM